MQTKTDGLIIRETNVGENDRILTILTRDRGVVRASARGARKMKGRYSAVCRLLSYSRLTLFHGREKYIIDDAEPVELFMGVRGNLEKLALAQYFCELGAFFAPQEEPAENYLRLTLNALHLLETGARPAALVKAVFEMRILVFSGYAPDLAACRTCGKAEGEMFFLPLSGILACGECFASGEQAVPLTRSALAALRHAAGADFERLFSFALPQEGLKQFASAAERFLLCHAERTFNTLEFYRGLAGQPE